MNTCEATPSAAQEIRIQSLGTPEIDSPLSRNLATGGERRVVFTVDEELVDEGAAPRPMSFELAGPRDRIYFDPSKTKCAIVTCGGLCPGINDVIRAIVMTAYNAYRVPSVLGIRYGLQGIIPSYRYDVRELAPRDVEGIHEFGGTILGTSRGPQSSSEIATALERLNISALFIIGGDGTMKAAASIQQEVARRGKHISIVGIPKTIDNDLVLTDHTPGYGSAAKYVASTVREIAIDASVYDNKPSVTIVEIMGRHAGWLTAASVLARKFKGDNPVLIYLPEVAFSPDAFIEKVKEKLTKTSNLVVCISEGINDGNGTFVCELASDVGTDTFGHKMLTGSGKYLENLVKEKLGIKVRSVELNVCQRCSSSCLSATDLDEAAASGRFAVSAALDGETGKMINFIRKSDDPYILEFGTADVNEICNKEKTVPEEWITKDGSDIGDEFIAYARPLIQGSVEVPMKDGLPYFAFRK